MPNAKWNTAAVMRAQEARLEDALELSCDIVLAEVRPRTPVLTGKLKGGNSKRRAGKLHMQVFNDVEYAIHQEFGTRFMNPQPFMRPGYRAAMPKINRMLKKL